MVYPYQKSHGEYYPVVKLSLIHQETKLIIEALVDSGANISIFSADVAESLGIDIESGKKMFLGGVGGRILGYEHLVEMEIAGRRFSSKVVFSREFLVSFNLIGRESVFDRFIICFNEKRRIVELRPQSR